MTTDDDPPELTPEEIAAGWRWSRLGKGPWRKLPPGTKTARDYLEEHRARDRAIRGIIKDLEDK
jgi:hypothetical protein